MKKINGCTVKLVNYSLIEKSNQMKSHNEGKKFNPRFEISSGDDLIAVIDTHFFWKEGELYYYNWVFVDSDWEFEQNEIYKIASKYVNSVDFELQLKRFEHECAKAYFELNKKHDSEIVDSFVKKAHFRWSV